MKLEQPSLNKKPITSLEKFGAKVTPDIMGEEAYILEFNFEKGVVTTVRILMKDSSGSDVVITNMTTLPSEQTGRGFGSKAVQSILQWAKDSQLREVRATQVQSGSEPFWVKNGFKKDTKHNLNNDYIVTVLQ